MALNNLHFQPVMWLRKTHMFCIDVFCYYEIFRGELTHQKYKMLFKSVLKGVSFMIAICSGYSKRGNVSGEKKNPTYLCYDLDSGQIASITILEKTLLLPSALSHNLYFSFQMKNGESLQNPLQCFQSWKQESWEFARERCQLLQHGCTSLYFFCSCPLSCIFNSVQ